MYEMMIDLETLDTKSSAVVLSIGAVIFETMFHPGEDVLKYEIVDRFMRVLKIDPQIVTGRTVSESTLLWWQQQDSTARAEAFNPVRCSPSQALIDLRVFDSHPDHQSINQFWASPATFDFPIIESLAQDFQLPVSWTYRQKYDVRTVVNEASYSASDHDYSHIAGIAHTPVYDCEAQIDLLTAARNKINRRVG